MHGGLGGAVKIAAAGGHETEVGSKLQSGRQHLRAVRAVVTLESDGAGASGMGADVAQTGIVGVNSLDVTFKHG